MVLLLASTPPDIAGACCRTRATKSVGASKGFYVSEKPGEENTTEPVLAKIETAVAKTLQKLRTGDIHLANQERAEFSSFLGVTTCRTKAAREHMNSAWAERMSNGIAQMLRDGKVPPEAEEFAADIASGKKQITQDSKGWSIKFAFEQALKLAPFLERLPWGLMEAPDGEALITSDNPLLFRLENSTVRRFAFPISPRFLLIGDISNQGDGQGNLSRDQVADFNVRQVDTAHEEVYASFCCDELQALLDECFAERARGGRGPSAEVPS